jgi:hypothetical protein
MQLSDDVREFFANYCRAFEAFDAHALAAFFNYPVLFTRADSARPQTMIASASDYVSAIAPLLHAYRDLTVESGKIVDLKTIVLAPSLVVAVVDWQVIASDGDVLYRHQASYTLVRIEGWRIAAIALDELPKLDAALRARRSARSTGR